MTVCTCLGDDKGRDGKLPTVDHSLLNKGAEGKVDYLYHGLGYNRDKHRIRNLLLTQDMPHNVTSNVLRMWIQ